LLLLQHFESRLEGATEFALTNRVLLLRADSGVGLDIALGGLPFEESAVARSSLFAYPGGKELRTCSAEDLIIMKSFAGCLTELHPQPARAFTRTQGNSGIAGRA
jgi:hypothetical protein